MFIHSDRLFLVQVYQYPISFISKIMPNFNERRPFHLLNIVYSIFDFLPMDSSFTADIVQIFIFKTEAVINDNLTVVISSCISEVFSINNGFPRILSVYNTTYKLSFLTNSMARYNVRFLKMVVDSQPPWFPCIFRPPHP